MELAEGYYDGVITEVGAFEIRFNKETAPAGSFELGFEVSVGETKVWIYDECSTRTCPWDPSQTFFERTCRDLKMLGFPHWDESGSVPNLAQIGALVNTNCRIQAKLGKPNKEGKQYMQYSFAMSGAKRIDNQQAMANMMNIISSINMLRSPDKQIRVGGASAAPVAPAPSAAPSANPFG